jgi:hypothetical protein
MNSRFCKFLVVVLILGFFFVVSSQAKGLKLFGKSDEPAKSAEQQKPLKTEVNQPAVPGGTIKFDIVEHDFGKVGPDSVNDCNFTFTNVGKGLLKIDSVKGTCKCTVPDLKKKEYAPGESGVITVEFHAPKFQGDTSQRVMVFSDDPNNSTAYLTIKAYVQTKVSASPEQMTLSLIAPDGGVSPITLTSLDGKKFAVVKIESPGDVISVPFDPNNIAEKHVFNPVVDVKNLHKYLNGAIVFTITHPECGSIRVQYNCLKEFETSPSVVIIRNAVVGEIQKRTIYITSNYNQPIEIESITSDKGIIKVVDREKTENQYKLVAEIAPPLQEGKLRIFSDTLRIKLAGKEPMNISCRGFYKTDK